MQCLLVYDIPDDNKRNKVADVCMDYGLDRIQYSAFLGDLRPTHQEELMLKLKKILGRRPGNIQLFPLCQTDWEARREIINKPAGDEHGGSRDVDKPDESDAGDVAEE